MKYFTEADIKKIAKNTDRNYHGENYEFIAKKIHSPLLKEFKQINTEHKKMGYLDWELSDKRYKLGLELRKELENKSPEDSKAVEEAL